MRRQKRLQHIIALLLSALLLVLPMTAMAQEITQGTNSAVTLRYRDHAGKNLNMLRVRLYKVADVAGGTVEGTDGIDITYRLTQAFLAFDEEKGTGVHISGFSETALNKALTVVKGETDAARRARWQSIAATLAPYANTGVAPTAVRYTLDGQVRLSGMTPGLYLLCADPIVVKEADADYRYTYQPTFVMLPYYENGAWNYDREFTFEEGNALLSPKFRYEKEDYQYEVYKRWSSDSTDVRPSRVQVDIYRDDVLDRTVYLDASNNWRYAWTAGSGEWTVVERYTTDGYSVRITSEKTGSYTIDNTYNPPPEEEGNRRNPPPEEVPGEVLGTRRIPTFEPLETPEVLGSRRLPRTGQLDWPVPILTIVGLVLFAAGYYRNRTAVKATDKTSVM